MDSLSSLGNKNLICTKCEGGARHVHDGYDDGNPGRSDPHPQEQEKEEEEKQLCVSGENLSCFILRKI